MKSINPLLYFPLRRSKSVNNTKNKENKYLPIEVVEIILNFLPPGEYLKHKARKYDILIPDCLPLENLKKRVLNSGLQTDDYIITAAKLVQLRCDERDDEKILQILAEGVDAAFHGHIVISKDLIKSIKPTHLFFLSIGFLAHDDYTSAKKLSKKSQVPHVIKSTASSNPLSSLFLKIYQFLKKPKLDVKKIMKNETEHVAFANYFLARQCYLKQDRDAYLIRAIHMESLNAVYYRLINATSEEHDDDIDYLVENDFKKAICLEALSYQEAAPEQALDAIGNLALNNVLFAQYKLGMFIANNNSKAIFYYEKMKNNKMDTRLVEFGKRFEEHKFDSSSRKIEEIDIQLCRSINKKHLKQMFESQKKALSKVNTTVRGNPF